MSHAVSNCLTIIRRSAVEARTGLKRSTLYDKLNPKSPRFDRDFPSPIKIGSNAVGWLAHEVDQWIEKKVHSSRQLNQGALSTAAHHSLEVQTSAARLTDRSLQSLDDVSVSTEATASTTHTAHPPQEHSAPQLILTRSSEPSLKARPIQVEVRKRRPVQVSCPR